MNLVPLWKATRAHVRPIREYLEVRRKIMEEQSVKMLRFG